MPEYLSPGVYVEEIELGGKPIEGVSTSTAGFLGETERGPIAFKLITGFAQYQRLYGGHAWPVGKLSDAAKAPAVKEAKIAKEKADKDLAKKIEAEKAAQQKAEAPNATQAEKDALKKAQNDVKDAETAAKTAGDNFATANEGKMPAIRSYLPYAVEAFFANGGKRCYVGRIAGEAAEAASRSLPGVAITAVGPGSWGGRVGVALRKASAAKEDKLDKQFRLVVYYWNNAIPDEDKDAKGIIDPSDPATRDPSKEEARKKNWKEPAVIEVFDNLTWEPNSADYFKRQIHGRSQLVTVDTAGDAGKDDGKGAIQLLKLEGAGGGDDIVDLEDYKGRPDNGEKSPGTGLEGLAEVDDISIVCVPDANQLAGLTDLVVSHCERMKDRIAVLSADQNADDISELFPESKGTAINSKYAAFYYPWVKVIDPATSMPIEVPPVGHVAGIYARTDTERGVHKAPANEPVRGVIDLQFNITRGDQDILNPRGVNCIRSFPGRGILLWGARTTSGDPLWKYVNVRRLFIFLEKSIERATQWVVFEPNTQRLWGRIRQTISDFLTQVWKDGALMGTTPEQAFFVRCDETTMTPNEIETGRLIVIIGVAPARPAEFVIFRLAQWRSGSSITE
ncbi:MAG: phage tail sheath subtilisin-like domain-containing protein [Verrucomicrobiales bacterium]|nr:phage tail sheath subtilisin-like domain-containing protein [Verrucomicrobiales bacterium]